MEFGKAKLSEAQGAVLGHSVKAGGTMLKKGKVLDAGDISALQQAGVTEVFAARLGAADLSEDAAATTIGNLVAGQNLRIRPATTGRVNLHAAANGLAELGPKLINSLNRLNESLTIATVPNHQRVEVGQLVATVKIIAYALPGSVVDMARQMVEPHGPPINLRPFKDRRVGLVVSRLTDTTDRLIEKTQKVMADRIAALGGTSGRVSVVDHDTNAISLALNAMVPHHDIALIFGASAIADRRDVVPAAIEQVGGTLSHFGMPVDPGNLLLLAQLGDMPVIGVPTCARSPKLNGFDWVLERLMAGIKVDGDALMGMGVGGLLKEIPTRPQPRESAQ